MKNWKKDLKRYQLAPPPPKMTLQAYILKYLESGDEIYFRWFLHAVEPMLNQTASAMVQHYAMYGFFLDLKQACVEGILKALQAYDPDKGTPFLWYARQYYIPDAIHDFIRLARPGFTVHSKDEYDTLRKVMWLYQDLKNEDTDPIKRISEETEISEKRVEEYLRAGMRNMSLVSLEIQQNQVEDEESSYVPAPDYSTNPARLALRMERQEALFTAFEKLNYREQDILASHLGFCPKCLSTKNADGSYRQQEYFEDLAIPYGLTPKAASKVYDRAIEKLRKALQPWKNFGEEDQLESSSVV